MRPLRTIYWSVCHDGIRNIIGISGFTNIFTNIDVRDMPRYAIFCDNYKNMFVRKSSKKEIF